MAAECSWSASSARLARRDLTHQADEVAMSIAELGDPHFAPIHPGDDVRLGVARCARRFDAYVFLMSLTS